MPIFNHQLVKWYCHRHFSLVNIICISNYDFLVCSCSWLWFIFCLSIDIDRPLSVKSRVLQSLWSNANLLKSCFLEIIDQSLRSGLNINEAINMQKREYLLPQRRRVELWKFCFCLKVNICWRISLAFLLELVFNLICNTLSRIMPHARLTDRWLIINLTPTELMHLGHQVLASSTCPQLWCIYSAHKYKYNYNCKYKYKCPFDALRPSSPCIIHLNQLWCIYSALSASNGFTPHCIKC